MNVPKRSDSRWKVRKAAAEDEGFIFDSWLKSYRNAPAVTHAPNEVYFPAQRAFISQLWLARETPDVPGSIHFLVACDPEDPSDIFGWACIETFEDGDGAPSFRLHFVYVKEPYRGHGIAAALTSVLHHLPVEFSHWTPAAGELLHALKTRGEKAATGWRHNPWLVCRCS